MKTEEQAVNETITLVEKFSTFMTSIGKVAGAVAEASTQAAALAKQAREVKKSMQKCYENGKKGARA